MRAVTSPVASIEIRSPRLTFDSAVDLLARSLNGRLCISVRFL
jgi:hypothetical protein